MSKKWGGVFYDNFNYNFFIGEKPLIRPVTTVDASAICDIYNHYIDHTVISFEYKSVSVETMQQRIANTTAKYPWFVYEEQGKIIAYAYANLWKEREAYKHVLETTVYDVV